MLDPQLPDKAQKDKTLEHHKNPVSFWTIADPVPNKTKVNLPDHKMAST